MRQVRAKGEASQAVKKVLHVGCGIATIQSMTPGFHQGWEEIRLDIDPTVKPDIVGTMNDMGAVADGSVDAIYSSHNIEHVHAHQVAEVLREFRRVLGSDGFAIITCPDIESVARHVAEGRLTDTLYMSGMGPICALDIIYGHSASIAAGNEHMAHRTAFTARTLLSVLQSAGFGTVLVMRRQAQLDLWALATNNRVGKDEARTLAAAYFPPEEKGEEPGRSVSEDRHVPARSRRA